VNTLNATRPNEISAHPKIYRLTEIMQQLKVGGEGGSKKNVLAERQHVCAIDC
jgi:hypothetical protein